MRDEATSAAPDEAPPRATVYPAGFAVSPQDRRALLRAVGAGGMTPRKLLEVADRVGSAAGLSRRGPRGSRGQRRRPRVGAEGEAGRARARPRGVRRPHGGVGRRRVPARAHRSRGSAGRPVRPRPRSAIAAAGGRHRGVAQLLAPRPRDRHRPRPRPRRRRRVCGERRRARHRLSLAPWRAGRSRNHGGGARLGHRRAVPAGIAPAPARGRGRRRRRQRVPAGDQRGALAVPGAEPDRRRPRTGSSSSREPAAVAP